MRHPADADRICRHAIDLLALAGRKLLLRIKTPAALEQSLAPQNLVNAWDASVKMVRGIEDGGIGVGDLLGQGLAIRPGRHRAKLW